MAYIENESCITVGELLDFLSDRNTQGEVWVRTGENASSPVKAVWDLNTGDILLED